MPAGRTWRLHDTPQTLLPTLKARHLGSKLLPGLDEAHILRGRRSHSCGCEDGRGWLGKSSQAVPEAAGAPAASCGKGYLSSRPAGPRTRSLGHTAG